jgi:hypothetical protein
MAASGNTVYAFSGSGSLIAGVQKEDLLEQITNVDPWESPWVAQAPKVGCRHVYHQWLQDTLSTQDLTGANEGEDWSLSSTTAPTRSFNITMILRKDIGLSETERSVDSAGFKDHYAYEVQKATKELAIKLEKVVFGKNVTATGAATVARVMKGLQAFIVTNTAYAGANVGTTVGLATADGLLAAGDFNDMLNTIFSAGGSPEQVYVSPKVKRQISAFSVGSTTTPHSRNIAAVDKKLVSAIDFYDSDFGLIQVVLDRWVPESTNTVTAVASASLTGGQMFFLSRAINRLAWLRPLSHQLIGKRGDSVAGYVVGEVTLEVLNEKANGRMLSVNNKNTLLGT